MTAVRTSWLVGAVALALGGALTACTIAVPAVNLNANTQIDQSTGKVDNSHTTQGIVADQSGATGTATTTAAASAKPGAVLAYVGYTFRRHHTSELSDTDGFDDNGDKVIQRGETVILDPKIKNTGGSKTDFVTAKIVIPDDEFATVKYESQGDDGKFVRGGTYVSIDPDETKTPDLHVDGQIDIYANDEGLVLRVSKDCPSGHVINAKLNLQDKYGNAWSLPFTITIP